MAQDLGYIANDVAHDFGKNARRAGLTTARLALKAIVTVGTIVAGAAGTSGVFLLGGIIGMASGIGINAYLNRKDHDHELSQLTKMYEKELGNILGKASSEVDVDDLKKVAEKNPTIRKQIEHAKYKSNVKTAAWAAGALLAFATAGAVFVAATAASTLAAGVVAVAVMQAYHLFGEPLVHKAYGVDRNSKTTVDLIKGLERDLTPPQIKPVTPAKVMQVFLSTNPKVEEQIEKKFGKPFIELSREQQEPLILQYSTKIPIKDISQAINNGEMNPRELVFAIHGQRSGVEPDKPYRDKLKAGMSKVTGRVQNARKSVAQAGQRAAANVKNFVSRNVRPGPSHDPQPDSQPGIWEERIKAERAQGHQGYRGPMPS